MIAAISVWWEALLIHVHVKGGDVEVGIGVLPILVLFWIGAEIVKQVRTWPRRPPTE